MSDEIAHLPAWVRRRDGSQVPFDADRICQSLYAAADSLGAASAFLVRELTDAVLHFLSKNPFDGIPTTAQVAGEVEKIVREVGHPSLALRYAELQRAPATAAPARPIAVAKSATPERFLRDCLEEYALQTIFSPDVAGAAREGLLRLGGLESPATLPSLVLEAPRLAELPWWLALDDWRAAGGSHWIVESPEWLCTPQMHPALTPHLCERLLSLPMLGDRAVELHLNIHEPPSWSPGHQVSPLFSGSEDEGSPPERINFLDGLLERWRSLRAPRTPALAWHVQESSFRGESERRQLQAVVRLALQGRAVRFVFDRARTPIALAEGLERRSPGVLLEVGLDLARFAELPDIAQDAGVFLKKLPSLARIAVSAGAQKRQYLRALPATSPLKRRFLIERAAAVVVPLGLDAVVQRITGASATETPQALDFALHALRILQNTLQSAGRALNLDLRLDGELLRADTGTPRTQIETAGKLHAQAGAGTAVLAAAEDTLEAWIDLLFWAWQSTSVLRLKLARGDADLHQGELPI